MTKPSAVFIGFGIFSKFSLMESLVVAGLMLTLLLAIANPSISLGLSFGWRIVFWAGHCFAGLLGIWLASIVFRRFFRQLSMTAAEGSGKTIALMSVTGALGAFFAAPIFLLIELPFPDPPADDALDAFAQKGWWQAWLAEWLSAAPLVIGCWLLLNLPVLLTILQGVSSTSRKEVPQDDPSIIPTEPLSPIHTLGETAVNNMDGVLKDLLSSLPQAIGRDIVAISSDLHYLHIYTTQGKAMILGSLRDFAAAMGEKGIQVHRSHWVVKQHVVQVVINSKQAYCLTSTGLKLPISRSQRRAVKELFGVGVISVSSRGH